MPRDYRTTSTANWPEGVKKFLGAIYRSLRRDLGGPPPRSSHQGLRMRLPLGSDSARHPRQSLIDCPTNGANTSPIIAGISGALPASQLNWIGSPRTTNWGGHFRIRGLPFADGNQSRSASRQAGQS